MTSCPGAMAARTATPLWCHAMHLQAVHLARCVHMHGLCRAQYAPDCIAIRHNASAIVASKRYEAAPHLLRHWLDVCPPLELQEGVRPAEVLHVLRQLLQLERVPELVVAGVGQCDAGYERKVLQEQRAKTTRENALDVVFQVLRLHEFRLLFASPAAVARLNLALVIPTLLVSHPGRADKHRVYRQYLTSGRKSWMNGWLVLRGLPMWQVWLSSPVLMSISPLYFTVRSRKVENACVNFSCICWLTWSQRSAARWSPKTSCAELIVPSIKLACALA
jgi:hypothetical protein